ncbi:MAG: alpha-L-fucosidase [Bacteroidales bacterium]|jgi:alpha-L-fucosidase|nr:alpha-L-fucosidase [Bacteroidales bacterium]
MKKTLLLLLTAYLLNGCCNTKTTPLTEQTVDHSWFEEARFGLFVHFGPYSVLCDGEWIMQNKPYHVDAYSRLQGIFNPTLFDAKEWVQLAKDAGMKYINFTSRHHDGFSNWNTKHSDWNIMNTPYGKDLIKQLADECHRQGIKLVLYYSLIDWYRTDYSHTTGRTGKGTGRTGQCDWQHYIQFMKDQLTELLTNYGEIAGIWFDGEWDQLPREGEEGYCRSNLKVDWHFCEIYALIHRLQPNCMIANNSHLPPLPGEDYQIFERDLPGENTAGYSGSQPVINTLPLETCQTISRSWGFRLSDTNYKSTTELIHFLVRAAGYNANLLLNVGPLPTGQIDSKSALRLREMGQWLKVHGETIYGTKGGHIRPQSWGAITQKGNKHYIHILVKEDEKLTIPFPEKIESAKWMNINRSLKWTQNVKNNEVTFVFDGTLDPVNSIIEVIVK